MTMQYREIADIIKDTFRGSFHSDCQTIIEDLQNKQIEMFCELFEKIDPQFHSSEFCEAAGYCAKVPHPDSLDIHDQELGYDNALGQTRN